MRGSLAAYIQKLFHDGTTEFRFAIHKSLYFFKRVQLPEKKEFRIAEAELYDVPAFFSIHFPSILFIKRPGQIIRFVRA